jgi:DNA-binding transcriptional LysR family regulator
MKLPVDCIEAFIHIAEQRSFQKAAEQLFISQTGLTHRLKRLESHVGLRLVDRTTHFIGLTSVGRDFLPQAQRAVESLKWGLERMKSMAKLGTGDVTVACLQSLAYYRLPIALAVYAKDFPENRVQVLERTGAQATEAVRRGQAEFGLHILQAEQPDLTQEELLRDPFVLFCQDTHPLASARSLRWTALKGQPLITLGGNSGNRVFVEERMQAAGLKREGRYVVENFASAVGLVSVGLGVAVLPASMATDRMPHVRQVPLTGPVVHRAIALVRRRDVSLSPAAQALHDVFKRELSGGASAPASRRRQAPRKPARR